MQAWLMWRCCLVTPSTPEADAFDGISCLKSLKRLSVTLVAQAVRVSTTIPRACPSPVDCTQRPEPASTLAKRWSGLCSAMKLATARRCGFASSAARVEWMVLSLRSRNNWRRIPNKGVGAPFSVESSGGSVQ